MIAALPMYDWPALRWATDAFWAAWRDRLRAEGFDAPEALTRDRPPEAIWRDPEMLVSQTCGYPYVMALRGSVRLLATPIHLGEAPEGHYCSVIVVRKEDPARSLADLRGRRVAYNSPDSQSGFHALRAAVAPLAEGGRFFAEAVATGAHLGSMQAVAEGRADCAAIDSICWALAARHHPGRAARLRPLCETPPTPALPYVVAAHRTEAEIAAIRRALFATLADPTLTKAREGLMLSGAQSMTDAQYAVIADRAAEADAAGYRDLR